MTRRISFFVESAKALEHGWSVLGTHGLGPIGVGDVFTAVVHRSEDDAVEERAELVVEAMDGANLVLTTRTSVILAAGDVLVGEAAP